MLGLANADEIAEIELLRVSHTEIEEAIKEFSILYEEQAMEHAIAPPPMIKSKIMAAIHEEEVNSISPVVPLGEGKEGNAVVQINYFRRYRLVAAASVILLISSAALNIYLFNKYNQKNNAYLALLGERNTLVANNQVYQTQLHEWQSAAEMMADPQMVMIKMAGVTGKPQHLATVFWNTQNKNVYVMPNKLPHPQAGKQFQLWALVNGKPVDAGMLDPDCVGFCKMKNIPEAEAFAITLENEGGVPLLLWQQCMCTEKHNSF